VPEPYKWRENNACVATYKILEGDVFLDQFEDIDTPFPKAPGVKLGTLRYFPKTTSNADLVRVLSFEMARRFLTIVTKVFTVRKQKPRSSAAILAALAGVFADGNSTIKDLAEVVDGLIKFPDEP
jgi:hypothetical protein